MPDNKSSLKVNLPADYDGIFRFTNASNEDFKAKWDNVEYSFKAMSTTPMLIPKTTPEEVQSIRKKFAKEYAIREFYKTPKFIGMNSVQPGGVPALYTDKDLEPFIQQCLTPLPIAKPESTPLPPTFDESSLKRDEEGEPVTKVIRNTKKSLINEVGSEMASL